MLTTDDIALIRSIAREEAERANLGRQGVLTVRDAARYCGIAAQTLYNLRSHGKGPRASMHGRKVVFRAADLDDWLASRLVPEPA